MMFRPFLFGFLSREPAGPDPKAAKSEGGKGAAGQLKTCAGQCDFPAAAQPPLPPLARKRHPIAAHRPPISRAVGSRSCNVDFVTGRAAKLRAGSTSRPDLEWVVFVKDFEIIARLDLIAAEHADHVAGFEEDDGDHQGAGEVQGMVLSQSKIVRHLRAFHL
ncbi:hypothetical protein [Mesorhizobium sp. M2A.F.Ca.ET.029.05.1.1]|uniref:hypothetical protein n=2 Tax=unclassified Mesorhizobium TaxID=325217 RepID=UPI0016784C90